MKILSIETSCDETSAAVVEKQNGEEFVKVLSNITATSLNLHAETGGIIPEFAAREQAKAIIPVITKALLGQNNTKLDTNDYLNARNILTTEIDAIAITHGPGLIGSLLVGVETAKTLSYSFKKPIIPVNHLLAHLFANYIKSENYSEIKYPFVGLIVSGGHTDLLLFKKINEYKWLGGTRDDAAGEAIDKIGRLLGLSYPAGPEMEKRALLVTTPTLKFKSPLINSNDFDFSFSGLKAEASRFIEKNKLNETLINQICFATQKAIFDVLIQKTARALNMYNTNTILLGGGVSANQTLKQMFEKSFEDKKIKIHIPEKKYSTDNGAMIGAWATTNYNPLSWNNITAMPELYFI